MTIKHLMAGAALALTGLTAPIAAQADTSTLIGLDSVFIGSDLLTPETDTFEISRRGRGGDGKSGRRPRVPGGSGCDDPGDVAEHPECRA